MPRHKFVLSWLLFMLPCVVLASGTPDTFGKLLEKHAQLLESNLDTKIRESQPQADIPLGFSTNSEDNEPTIDAIWGLAGKEVVEMRFQGKRIAVSMQNTEISKSAGWRLEQVNPYQVVIVRVRGNKIVQRKTIHMDWQGEDAAMNSVNTNVNATNYEVISPVSTPTLHISK